MINYNEIKQQAEYLRKEKKFSEAGVLYKQLLETDVEPDKYVLWGHAFCLKNTKKYIQALDICRKTYKKHPDFKINNNI